MALPMSSNLRLTAPSEAGGMTGNFKFHRGIIVDIIPITDIANISRRYTEYIVDVEEDGVTISRYMNVRALDNYGDPNNFSEINYQSLTDTNSLGVGMNPFDIQTPNRYKNASYVLIGTIYGRKDSAFIVGALNHPFHGYDGKENNGTAIYDGGGNSTSRDERLKKLPTLTPGLTDRKEAPRLLEEFNGIRWNINRDGELTVIFQGAKNAKGEVTNQLGPTILKINKDGEIFFIDKFDQEVKISPKTKKILISDGVGDLIEIDRASQTISVVAQKEIHSIGKNKTESVGGEQIEAIGKDKTTTVGGTWTIQSAKGINIQSPGQVTIQASLVNIL